MAGLSGRFVDVQPTVFAQWLRAAIYHGETPGDLIAVPLIVWASLATVFLVVGATFDFRRRRKAREGEQLRGPESMTVRQFNRTIPRKEKGFALRTR
jgi:membrane protein implicated in regulation of membrane protease activity